MTEPFKCPDCGTPLPEGTPSALCPLCGLREALGAHGTTQPSEPRLGAGHWPGSSPSRPTAGPPPAGEGAAGLKDQTPGSVPSVALPGLRGERARFGDYELIEEIAHGGMGVVYRARQISLDRVVAVKMLLFGQFAGKAASDRFRAEARTVAQLRHPNIVAIHEIGEADGQPFFSMDYVAGQNLAELVRDRPLAARQAAGYARTIARAVQYAHSQGVLHRDLKPANILIDESDEPRITDFGLARRLAGDSELTLTGQVLGSPNFMPPEQAAGKRGRVGPASDVYGLGGLLYYLLTARPPFVAETFEATLAQVLNHEPVAPRQLNPTVPRDLETLCLKCLEKDPARRCASAAELAEELDRFLKGEPIRARPLGPIGRGWRWSRRNPRLVTATAVAALSLLVGLVGVTWQWRRAEATAIRERALAYAADMRYAQRAVEENDRVCAMAALDRYQPSPSREDLRGWEWRYLHAVTRGNQLEILRGHEGIVACAQFSPDGKLMATAGFDRQVLIRDAVTTEVLHRLPVTANELVWMKLLCFSPDGTYLALQGEDGIGLWDARQGRLLRELPNSWCPLAFDREGKRLAAWSRGGAEPMARIRLWNTRDWTSEDIDTGFSHPRFPFMPLALSDDGSKLAAGSATQSVSVWDLALRDRPIQLPCIGANSLLFIPRSDLLFVGDSSGAISQWDLSSRQTIHRAGLHTGYVWDLTLSPDQRTLFSAGGDQTIRLWNTTDLLPITRLSGHVNEVWTVDCSSDGRSLLSAGKDGTARLWAVERQREAAPLIRSAPLFQGGRTRIFCLSGRGEDIIASDTNGVITLWAGGRRRAEIWPPDWRHRDVIPMGARDLACALFLGPQGVAELWDVLANRSIARLQLSEPIGQFTVSGDRRWLYGGGSREGTSWLWDLVTGHTNASFGDYSTEAWGMAFSHDSRFLARATTNHWVKVWDVAVKRELAILRGHPWKVSAIAFSPDDNLLGTGCWNGELHLWDTKTWKLARPPIAAHVSAVNWIEFHPGEPKVLTGTWTIPGAVRLWSLPTGIETLCFRGAGIGRFSPDGRTLALWRRLEGTIETIRVPSLDEAKGLASSN